MALEHIKGHITDSDCDNSRYNAFRNNKYVSLNATYEERTNNIKLFFKSNYI